MPSAAQLLNMQPRLAAGQFDRSIPMATPTGQFVPTPPTESQEQYTTALSNPSIANILYGAGEAGMSMLTSPIPYAAGMVGSAYGALTGQDPRATGARFEQATTLQPQSPLGQYYGEQVGEKLSSLPPIVSGITKLRPGAGSTRYAAETYAKPIAEKGLSMYEQGKLTPGFSPASELLIGRTAKTYNETAPYMVGPEGLRRQEISDKSAFLKGKDNFQTSVMDFLDKNPELVNKQGGEVLLKNIFEHPEAYSAYPELADYKVRFIKKDENLYGRKGSDNTIHVREDLTPEQAKSTILHELQHHIQENEGFARGGSARVFAKQPMQEHKHYMGAIENINKQMKDAVNTPKYSTLMDERDSLMQEARLRGVLYPSQVEAIATDKYKRLGGEAESRLVQERRNMTKEELAAQNPYDPEYFKRSTGVELQDLIMQGNKPGTDIFSILYK